MKVVLIILDGLQDDNVIGGCTPVEHAKAETLHNIARQSMPVVVKTMFHGLPVGSIVANLGLLGYDPYKYFPDGRSFFELRARYDGPIGEDDLILRCNTISANENDDISDFTAGQIPDDLAKNVIAEVAKKLPFHYELYHGKNYRNVLLIRDSSLKPCDIVAFEPHSRIGSNLFDLRIIHANRKLSLEQKKEIQYLNSVMFATIRYLAEINKTANSKADMLWFWAPSYPAVLFDFREHFGFSNSWVITGSDFLYGIAKEANIDFAVNDRYTGESDTDFAGKGREAVQKLKEGVDFLFIHINATDEESHQRDYESKVKMIEVIDRKIIRPVFDCVRSMDDDVTMIIGGDHYTSSESGNHLDNDAPFVVYRPKTPVDIVTRYSEREIIDKAGPTIMSTDLINAVLSNGSAVLPLRERSDG